MVHVHVRVFLGSFNAGQKGKGELGVGWGAIQEITWLHVNKYQPLTTSVPTNQQLYTVYCYVC